MHEINAREGPWASCGRDRMKAVPKPTSPASALARLPKLGLVRTYVWEKPVRISHWLMFFAFIALSFTGLYMHRPFLLTSGRASFLMARMRFIHVVSGFVLIAAIALALLLVFQRQLLGALVVLRSHPPQAMGGHGSDARVLPVHALRSRPPRGPQPSGRIFIRDHLSADSGRDSDRARSCTVRCWGILSCISSPTGCRC